MKLFRVLSKLDRNLVVDAVKPTALYRSESDCSGDGYSDEIILRISQQRKGIS